MTTRKMLTAVALALPLSFPGIASAQFDFTTIDVPDSTRTAANANSTHEVVGEFDDADGNTHGFVLSTGTYTQIDVDVAMEAIAGKHGPKAVGTVGEAVIANPSRNVIPGEIAFTVDCRSADAAIMDALDKDLRSAIAEIAARRKVEVQFDLIWRKPPTHFDPKLVDAVENAATMLGYSHRRITSGAGHDACNLNTMIPAAMVFVPCKDGISHNELEDATQADCAAGANVLMHTVLALAGVAS